MITKTFYKNKDGKIEFTESALKELLDEIYKEGFREGKRCGTYKYTTPGWWNINSPFYTYTNTTPLTLKSNSDYSTISSGYMTNTNTNDVPTATTTTASSNIVIKGEK